MSENKFEPLLTEEEVSKVLKVSRRTFYRLVNSRRLIGMKVGRNWRVSAPELRRFIDANTKKPGPRRAAAKLLLEESRQ